MDVTPQLLKDVDFREKKFGGYDPDEVDDFLERVGVAVGQLQMRLREVTQRAEAAEARLAEQPTIAPMPQAEADDTLRRTLLLAQRTADAAVAEAQEEASRIVTAAQDEAERHRAEDQERHERQMQESDEEVRRSVDETRKRLLAEIDELESIRDQLMTDVEVLERHVDDERARLQSTVGTLQGLLDAAGSMAPLEPPVVSAVALPREPEPNFDTPEADTGPVPEVVPAVAYDEAAYEPVGDPEPAPLVVDVAPEPPAPAPEPPLFREPAPTQAAPIFEPLPPAPAFGEAAPESAGVFAPEPAATPDVFAPEPAATPDAELFQQPPPPPPPPPPPGGPEPGGFGGLGGPVADDPWSDLPGTGTGPSTQPVEAVGDDNPWMADLAREEAANQPPPPPPADDQDAMAEWYRQQEEAGAKPEKHKRFGRKK